MTDTTILLMPLDSDRDQSIAISCQASPAWFAIINCFWIVFTRITVVTALFTCLLHRVKQTDRLFGNEVSIAAITVGNRPNPLKTYVILETKSNNNDECPSSGHQAYSGTTGKSHAEALADAFGAVIIPQKPVRPEQNPAVKHAK
jgi:hypothetical protein